MAATATGDAAPQVTDDQDFASAQPIKKPAAPTGPASDVQLGSMSPGTAAISNAQSSTTDPMAFAPGTGTGNPTSQQFVGGTSGTGTNGILGIGTTGTNNASGGTGFVDLGGGQFAPTPGSDVSKGVSFGPSGGQTILPPGYKPPGPNDYFLGDDPNNPANFGSGLSSTPNGLVKDSGWMPTGQQAVQAGLAGTSAGSFAPSASGTYQAGANDSLSPVGPTTTLGYNPNQGSAAIGSTPTAIQGLGSNGWESAGAFTPSGPSGTALNGLLSGVGAAAAGAGGPNGGTPSGTALDDLLKSSATPGTQGPVNTSSLLASGGASDTGGGSNLGQITAALTGAAPAASTDGNAGVGLTATDPNNPLTAQTITPNNDVNRVQQFQNALQSTISNVLNPQEQAAERAAAANSFGAGRGVSGMNRTSIGNVQSDYNNQIKDLAAQGLAGATTGSIEDMYRNLGIAQQQQQFQAGQQQNAFNQQLNLAQLQDALTNSAFGRAATQEQLGEANNPANIGLALSQIFGNQASQAGQAGANLFQQKGIQQGGGGITAQQIYDALGIRPPGQGSGTPTTATNNPGADNGLTP